MEKRENISGSEVHEQHNASGLKPIEILVVGDWVVDENWVIAQHRASFSTVEGKAHFRSLGNPNACTITFCGAGRVSRYLYWMNRFKNPEKENERDSGWIPFNERRTVAPFSVFGIGNWAKRDEARLYKLFHPLYPEGITPFTLTRAKTQENASRKTTQLNAYEELDGLSLVSLADACVGKQEVVGTTRVYRQYNLQAEVIGGLSLDQRVDFELRYTSDGIEEGSRKYDKDKLITILRRLHLHPEEHERMVKVAWEKYFLNELETLRSRLPKDSENNGWSKIEAAIDTLIKEKKERHRSENVSDSSVDKSYRVFPYVLVKDLGKGTISRDLIESLRDAGLIDNNTRWFISSKRPEPKYIELLRGNSGCGSIRLLFIPPMAIAQMHQTYQMRQISQMQENQDDGDNLFTNNWFVGGLEPTKHALEKLKELYEKNHSNQFSTLVIAMPKGLSILSIEFIGSTLYGFYQPKTILNEIDENLTGRASMFFAALSAQLIHTDCKKISFEEEKAIDYRKQTIETSLKASSDTVKGNINELRTFGNDLLGSSAKKKLFYHDTSFTTRSNSGIKVCHFKWDVKQARWDQSKTYPGIIRDKDKPYRLELWRAMGELDGYIEIVQKRRKEIVRLMASLKEFIDDRPKRPFSAMLIASPGSGKSYLVSRLAEALNLPHKSFNITQLVTRENVNSCFDEIASAQAEDRKRTHIVFFDEINSLVQGSPVYDLFLTVLDDGTYRRGGQLFKLDPCIWLFAGTRELRETLPDPKEEQELYASKEPDFKSRLSTDSVKLHLPGKEMDTRLSFVYQGAFQLQQQYSDVKKISAEVLRAFYSLELDTSNRKIKQLVGKFVRIQYGEVSNKNLPENLRGYLNNVDRKDAWENVLGKNLDDILVEIVRQPEESC